MPLAFHILGFGSRVRDSKSRIENQDNIRHAFGKNIRSVRVMGSNMIGRGEVSIPSESHKIK